MMKIMMKTTIVVVTGSLRVGQATFETSCRVSRMNCAIVFAIVLAVVQYIDRVAISQAKGHIAGDMGLTDEQMGAIFAAFGLSYALFEIPTGWMGDKIGARRVLARVVPASTFSTQQGNTVPCWARCLCAFPQGLPR